MRPIRGHGKGRDNPVDLCERNVGPIPPGTYYLIDRQSGGRSGWIRDLAEPYVGSTDRRVWFTLWNAHGGDVTNVCNIQRGNFRLHPEGPARESDGCITIRNPLDFDRLQRFIRLHKPDLPIPGQPAMKAYGRVEVR